MKSTYSILAASLAAVFGLTLVPTLVPENNKQTIVAASTTTTTTTEVQDLPTTTVVVATAAPPVPTLPTTTTTTEPPIPYGEETAIRGQCTQWEPLLDFYAPSTGWDVQIMSKIMWRESRCIPTARSTSRDSGLLQINDVHLDDFSKQWGFPVTSETFMDPVSNIKAAATLCAISFDHFDNCYRPWGINT